MIRTDHFPFQEIVQPLLQWYDENKRDLPWRKDVTPYRVLVSEIMLQQTRVEAVKGHFIRFVSALPTVFDLAKCDEDTLLKLWEGLGYYRRARNLQKTAQAVVENYDGVFPDTIDKLQKLSGIGEYTAGSIASIAFGKRTPAVDGNVLRVIGRLTENPTDISEVAYRKYLREKLGEIYPDEGQRCSDFTQAIMELGALVCKPTAPDCARCPLKDLCLANAHGTQEKYPVLPQKKAKTAQKMRVFHIKIGEKIAVRKREDGLMKGLYELPSIEDTGENTVQADLEKLGVTGWEIEQILPFSHIFTHKKWDIQCYYITAKDCPFWMVTPTEIKEKVSLPTAFRQCLKNDEIDF